jgi:hypothetical protein
MAQVLIFGIPAWLIGVLTLVITSLGYGPAAAVLPLKWLLLAAMTATTGVCIGTWLRRSPWLSLCLTLIGAVAWTAVQLTLIPEQSILGADHWLLLSSGFLTAICFAATLVLEE